MKIAFTFVLVLISLLGTLDIARAQAPAAIDGLAVTLTIKSGTLPFAKAGSYRFLPSATDNTYVVVGISKVANSDGTFDYTRTSSSTGLIDFHDSITGNGFTLELIFTGAFAGTYSIVSDVTAQTYQSGTFSLYHGPAQTSVEGWSFQIVAQTGTAPFAPTGKATLVIAPSGQSYQILGGSGIQSSTGTYAYATASASTSTLSYNDSVLGSAYTETLSWNTATQGAYVAVDGSGDFQAGTFTAIPPPAPVVDGTLTATGQVEVNFSYQITASGVIASYAASGLPPGLGVDSTSGLITGIPTEAGTFKVTLSATNGNTGKATLSITIAKAAATVTIDPSSLDVTYDGARHGPSVSTTPAGLPTSTVFTGIPAIPINAASYPFTTTINSPNAAGSATGTLTIEKAAATVTLGPLTFAYTGKPIAVTATTVPAKLAVAFTYNGSATAPTVVGDYPVVATITDANHTGTASGTLHITSVPAVVTTGVAAPAAFGAVLAGSVNPEGSDTMVHFEYGTSTSYGHSTPALDAGAGTALVQESAAISGLTAGTIYHFREVGSSAGGTIDGADKTFNTLLSPTFTNTATNYLSATGAQVTFGVTPNGVATTIYFEYSTDSNFGTFLQTPPQIIGSGKTEVVVTGFLPELAPDTPYFFRVVTTGPAGTINGPTETLTTLGFDTSTAAQPGEMAPDVPNGTFAAFRNPAIDDHDAVAFHGILNLTTGITAANCEGIWADDNAGARHLIARIGIPGGAPLATGTGEFTALGDPVLNNNAKVAFTGTLAVGGAVTKATTAGVWSTSGGSLALVAQAGMPAPGANGATFGTFNSIGLPDTGGAIILATLAKGTGVTASNNTGIWQGNSTADLRRVIGIGDAFGPKVIKTLTALNSQTVTQGQTRNFNPSNGSFVCSVIFTDGSSAILEVTTGSTLQFVVQSGQVAPDAGGNLFSLVGLPIVNANDNLAFLAQVTDGATDFGLWANNSGGALHLVARTGTAAPGTGGTFTNITVPVYNNNEEVAFGATYVVGTGKTAKTFSNSIWTNAGGTLALLTQPGAQAPGCPTGAFFATFTGAALDDVGPVFLATLTASTTAGVTAANNTGIWAVDPNGVLQLVVRTGDAFLGKTITSLSFLPPNNLLDNQSRNFVPTTGDLVYLATFSDGSTAIFNVQFP